MIKKPSFGRIDRMVIVAGLLFFVALPCNAQFTLTGELRPRTEYRHGYITLATPGQDAAFFTDQRTRLNLDYLATKFKVRLVIQDVRTWGGVPQLNTADGLTSIHEAWGEILFSQKFSAKLGRQEIIYDDHRIFGNVGWAQQARSHDAAILKYKKGAFLADAGFAYNQDSPSLSGTIARNGTYKAIQYLWLHQDFGEINGSFLFLNNGRQVITTTADGTESGSDNYSQTTGVRLEYKKKKITAHLAGYFQSGVDADSVATKISAYYAMADISYKVSDPIDLAIGVELLSGNSETNPDSKNRAFNPFYGTNHKFNGHMDYFYVGNHIGSVGLNDIFLQARYNKNKFYVGGDLHFFSSNNDLLDDAEYASTGRISNANSFLGTEIDLTGGYAITKGVDIKIGYSHLFATDAMEFLKGGDSNATNNWGWLMIEFKPGFIENP